MTPKPLVVDTSVVVKWFLEEPHTPQALEVQEQILRGAYRPLAPDLVYLEFANTIWKHVKRHELEPSDGEAMIAALLDLQIDVIPSRVVLVPAYRIAHALGSAVYDAVFLALGQEADADMITADQQLYETAHAQFSRLRWLAAWQTESGPPS